MVLATQISDSIMELRSTKNFSSDQYIDRKEILAIVKRPLFRCKSREGINPHCVIWRRMNSCNLPVRK